MHMLVIQGKEPVPVVVFLGPKQRSGSETPPGLPRNPRDKDRTTSDFKVQLSAVTPIYRIPSWVMDSVMTFSMYCTRKAERWSLCTDVEFQGCFDGSYGTKEKISNGDLLS